LQPNHLSIFYAKMVAFTLLFILQVFFVCTIISDAFVVRPSFTNTRSITSTITTTSRAPPNHSYPYLCRGHKMSYDDDGMTLADDEPLSSRFQRAVVLQRAGDHESALREYQLFVKAAEQCDVSPDLYAEVRVNMGAVFMKIKDRYEAKRNFELALQLRDMGSAHVNLALLALAEGQMSNDPRDGVRALKEAEGHCRKAVDLNDDVNAVNGATRLLGDIGKMLDQMNAR